MLQDVLFLKGHFLPPYDAQKISPIQINDYKELQTLIQNIVLNNLEHFQWNFNVRTSNTSLKHRVKSDLTALGFDMKFANLEIFPGKFSIAINRVDPQCDRTGSTDRSSKSRQDFNSEKISQMYFANVMECLNSYFSPDPLTQEPPKDLIVFDGATLPPGLSVKLRSNLNIWYGYNIEVYNDYFLAKKKESKSSFDGLKDPLMWEMHLFRRVDAFFNKWEETQNGDVEIDIRGVSPDLINNLRLYASEEYNCHTFLKENTLFISKREGLTDAL